MSKLYDVVRARIHRTPWLFHGARSVRFALMVGPLRRLVVALSRIPQRPPTWKTSRTLFDEFDPVEAADRLERDGFTPGLKLPAEQVREIRDQLERSGSTRCLDPHRKWSVAASVAHDPALIELARRYFGTEPVVFQSILWWSEPTAEIEHQHRFHFDVADFKSLTVFIYMTDVDRETGAHTVIRGTHQRKSLAQCVRIYLTDEEAERRYGDRIEVVTGPSGTGFAEELTLYHKARPLTDRRRLMLGITYTLRRKPKTPSPASPIPLTETAPVRI